MVDFELINREITWAALTYSGEPLKETVSGSRHLPCCERMGPCVKDLWTACRSGEQSLAKSEQENTYLRHMVENQ